MKDNTLIIYTDGAYSSSKRKGGWAFYCPQYRLHVCNSDTSANVTNNRMEMMAAIKALEWVVLSQLSYKNIIIVSDSQYVIKTMQKIYHQSTNLDLWKTLDDYVAYLSDRNISWVHVKGHNGNINNEVVDKFANLISQI